MNRRSFIKKTPVIGASSFTGSSIISLLPGFAAENPTIDIAAVRGEDYFKNTIKAVDLLGGIKKFIFKGATVGLLSMGWVKLI